MSPVPANSSLQNQDRNQDRNQNNNKNSDSTLHSRRAPPGSLNLNDLADPSFPPPRITPKGYMDLPSPRAGEIPPALSPLDAFAMQSRLLARRFEQESEDGRRISRLPPVMVAKEMGNRPGYFRSLSNESRMSDVAESEGDDTVADMAQRGLKTQPAHDRNRPTSHYPTIDRASGVSVPDNNATPFYDAAEHQPSSRGSPSYFGMPRASSPEPADPKLVNVQAPSPGVPSLTSSIDTISSHPRTRTNDSQRSQRSVTSDRGGLAPPQSPRFPRSPRSFQSIRSVPQDSGDEDGQSAGGSNHVASARKFSGSSNMSRPQSPFSPWQQPAHRSPSMTSEYSMTGSHQLQRPSGNFHNNFSRPMSSSGSRPSFDTRPSVDGRPSFEARPGMPIRQPSGASNHSSTHLSSKPPLSRSGSGDDAETPHFGGLQTPNAENFQFPANTTPGEDSSASYIYAKYALPRGRPVERDSTAFRDSWIQKQFEWDRQHDMSHPQHPRHERNQSDSPRTDPGVRPSPSPSDMGRTGRDLAPAPSATRSLSADPRGAAKAKSLHRASPSVKTESTDRTIKASPLHQKSASADLTPEEHLDIGIDAHDSGATTKSTYHLRLAAFAGLPTGMLLYALACRHGWGMRPNQEEGVKWLRKAIDVVGLDVADAEEKLTGAIRKSQAKMTPDPVREAGERKKRKAQYALAIYELGNSSMNGWGCPKDKALAVRCYEIAGAWGDMDALAEAGFCYTSGIGCKKDLKKAASLYRTAAEGGMSMAGNSWIYKDKYMSETPGKGEKDKHRPDTAVSSKEAGRKGEDKHAARPRSRSIWRKGKEKDKDKGAPPMPPTSVPT